MPNDDETRDPCKTPNLERGVALDEASSPADFESRSAGARSGTRRLRERAFAQKGRELATALVFAAFSASAQADAPRAASKPDAGPTASKSTAPGRSKAPSGTTSQAPPPAAALKTEPEGPEAEGKARAQAVFEQAVSAYKEGRYFDAVELFLETNRIYPDSKLCFNIARAYEGLGSSSGALRYYREYLRRTPNASDKADVEASVRQLELALSQKGLQQLSVSSTPDGAVLSIDGRPIALTPWTGEIWPGKHRLTLTHPGYAEGQQLVELSPFRANDVQVELKAEPPAQPPALASDRADQGRGISLLTVATLAAGAVLMGTALVVKLSQDNSSSSTTPAFLGGAGVGATAVGGVLFYFDVTGTHP